MNKQEDIFYIQARKCRRCGGILTSPKAIKDGYGCVCKRKEKADRSPSSTRMIGAYMMIPTRIAASCSCCYRLNPPYDQAAWKDSPPGRAYLPQR